MAYPPPPLQLFFMVKFFSYFSGSALTRLKLWNSGQLMNTVNWSIHMNSFDPLIIYAWKKFVRICLFLSSPDEFPKGSRSIPELLPLHRRDLTCRVEPQKIWPSFSFLCTISRTKYSLCLSYSLTLFFPLFSPSCFLSLSLFLYISLFPLSLLIPLCPSHSFSISLSLTLSQTFINK